jgi:type I restriction enzyme S subunit
MIDGLSSYPEYKDSGLPWLGEIPAHWEVRRNGRLFRQRNETGFPDLPILEVSLKTGVRIRDFENSTRKQVMSDREKYKRARQGDIAYNMMRMWQGAVGVAPVDGLISPAYIVAQPLPETDARYYENLFRIDDYKNEINKFSRGIVSDRNRLYWEDFKQIPSPFPPPEEQAAIVRFLEHVDRRIRRYIRAKRQLISLLIEQKQAIIHRAVTRGLDPDVRFKPSGVEWVDEIPEHFQRAKLARLCRSIRDGTHNPPRAVEGIHRLLSVRNIVNGRFVVRDDDRTMSPEAFEELQRSYTVKEGDVVLALVGGTTGKSAVVQPMEHVTIQRSLGILRPNPRILDSHYLNYVISSRLVQAQIQQIMVKYAAQPGIYLNDVGELQVFFPDLQHQREIVSTLQIRMCGHDELISLYQRQIELMASYRVRLIADVVTGKLDVRQAATQLPGEIDEGDATGDELLEGDDVTDDVELDAELDEVDA